MPEYSINEWDVELSTDGRGNLEISVAHRTRAAIPGAIMHNKNTEWTATVNRPRMAEMAGRTPMPLRKSDTQKVRSKCYIRVVGFDLLVKADVMVLPNMVLCGGRWMPGIYLGEFQIPGSMADVPNVNWGLVAEVIGYGVSEGQVLHDTIEGSEDEPEIRWGISYPNEMRKALLWD